MLATIFGARIAGWLAGIGGYIVAAGAVVFAVFGLYAKVRRDGKQAGIAQQKDLQRKAEDKAMGERNEVKNDIRGAGADAARERLRNDWKR